MHSAVVIQPQIYPFIVRDVDRRAKPGPSPFEKCVMGTSTHFTMICRMRNTGALPWRQGLRLVRENGLRTDVTSVLLQIPPEDVPVGGELDIAIDLVVPCLHTRRPLMFSATWLMATQSGTKFGEEVKFRIMVNDSERYVMYKGHKIQSALKQSRCLRGVSSDSNSDNTIKLKQRPMKKKRKQESLLRLLLKKNDGGLMRLLMALEDLKVS